MIRAAVFGVEIELRGVLTRLDLVIKLMAKEVK